MISWGEGSIAQWIAFLFLTHPLLVQILAPEYFFDVAELINRSSLFKVRVDSGISLIVD